MTTEQLIEMLAECACEGRLIFFLSEQAKDKSNPFSTIKVISMLLL